MAKIDAVSYSEKKLRVLLIGDSGTGKTGSMISLLHAGYELRILDMDNGLDSLISLALHEDEKLLDQVDAISLRDPYVSSPLGPVIKGIPTAYTKAVGHCGKAWDDGTGPADWSDKTILVIDSLTTLGRACFEWARAQNPTAKDARQWYFTAQQSLTNLMSWLTGPDFPHHVLIISHISLVEVSEGLFKGFPSAIGQRFSQDVGKYFNVVVCAETMGSGKAVRRTIRTVSTGIVELKTPVPFKLDAALPLETGLSTLFAKMREKPKG